MNQKGMTLIELIVVIALLTVIIAGASTVQLFTNKILVERSVTTDQRQIVEMIKDDIINSLMYAHQIELSSEDKTLSEESFQHVLGYDEKLGYMKDKEAVFGASLYNGNEVDLVFEQQKANILVCTIKVWEKGGIALEDTFPIKLLNVSLPNSIQGKFKYVYYK